MITIESLNERIPDVDSLKSEGVYVTEGELRNGDVVLGMIFDGGIVKLLVERKIA